METKKSIFKQLIVVKKYKETATADDRSIMSVSMLQELVFQEFSYSSVTRSTL